METSLKGEWIYKKVLIEKKKKIVNNFYIYEYVGTYWYFGGVSLRQKIPDLHIPVTDTQKDRKKLCLKIILIIMKINI